MSGGALSAHTGAPLGCLSASYPTPQCSRENEAPALKVWIDRGAGQTRRKEPSTELREGKRGHSSSAVQSTAECLPAPAGS